MNTYLPPQLPENYRLGASDASSAGLIAAWIVIIASVLFIGHNTLKKGEPPEADAVASDGSVGVTLEITARYIIGVRNKLPGGEAAASAALLKSLEESAIAPADKLALVAVIGEVKGGPAALERLNAMRNLTGKLAAVRDDLRIIYSGEAKKFAPATAPAEPTTAPVEQLSQAGKAATAPVEKTSDQIAATTAPPEQSSQPGAPATAPVQESSRHAAPTTSPVEKTPDHPAPAAAGVITPAERQNLINHIGWCGRLALIYGKPAANPERVTLMASANRTLIANAVGIVVLGMGILAGIILFVVALVRISDGVLLPNYRPPLHNAGPFVEGFAIYIGSFTTRMLLGGWSSRHPASEIPMLIFMIASMILAVIWPLFRGVEARNWQMAIGWHTGQGVFREFAMGFVGYLAGVPVLLVGAIITIVLVKYAHAHPSHPLDRMLTGSRALQIIALLLASLYAPITEETMFRGALFSGLRARHRWILTALITSFIFAAIHPQGWTTIPVLMSIAIVLAGIREWRGTILASAMAHGIHNSLLVAYLILATK